LPDDQLAVESAGVTKFALQSGFAPDVQSHGPITGLMVVQGSNRIYARGANLKWQVDTCACTPRDVYHSLPVQTGSNLWSFWKSNSKPFISKH